MPFGVGRNKSLAYAASKVGTVEHPAGSNRTEFGKRYGWDGVAWCNIFTSDTLEQTGNGGAAPKSAYVPSTAAWGRSIGRSSRTPITGAFAIFKGEKHIEFVESWNGKRLIQIGGNTSNGRGSTNEGGGCYRNDRTQLFRRGGIEAFIMPLYGISKDEMKIVQKTVGTKPDGIFGPATKKGVATWQADHGLKADGFPGPITYSAMTGQSVVGTSVPVIQNGSPKPSIITDGILSKGGLHARTIQERLKTFVPSLVVDGVIGPNTVSALQIAMGITPDGHLDGQNQFGRSKCPAFTNDAFRLGSGGSRTVRIYQAYTGLSVRDGLWASDTNIESARMLNAFPTFLTKEEVGVIHKRRKAAGL